MVLSRRDWAFINACSDGNLNVIKKSIKYGRNPHLGNDLGLCVACACGHFDVVKYLYGNHDCRSKFAIYWAKENKHVQIIEYLNSV